MDPEFQRESGARERSGKTPKKLKKGVDKRRKE